MMNKKIVSLLLVFLFTITSFSVVHAQVKLEATAGGVGGGWYNTLSTLAVVINQKDSSISINVAPGSGLANQATISEGQFDIGWAYPTFAKLAYEGKDMYDKEYKNVTAIATNWSPNYYEMVILADRDISSIEEIFDEKKPVRFLTGKQTTATGYFFMKLLEYYGVTVEDIESWGGKVIFTAYGDWPSLAQDDHVDIMINNASQPDVTLQEIMTYRKIKMLPFSEGFLDYMVEECAAVKDVIPAGTYEFLDQDMPSFVTRSGLYANKNVSDEVIYRILEILDENLEEIRSIHPSFKDFDTKNSWKNPGCPLHPAAEKFYKDKGYME